jgi:hypothetical protein
LTVLQGSGQVDLGERVSGFGEMWDDDLRGLGFVACVGGGLEAVG